ncbi:hypothetical protein LTR05_008397 [Lithohypha guttulata]|uniref:Uncharacterized protein n=1 Tax=Lithohypha guttulata TaxID=1690604 RepID=A0AAN7PJV0_9EURO|nr:hypothetical protein LTR05_008397 [Lithohypha guttulata]
MTRAKSVSGVMHFRDRLQGESPGSGARATLNEDDLDELKEGEILEVASIVKGKGRENAEESLPQFINP